MTPDEVIEIIISNIEVLGYEVVPLPVDHFYTNGNRNFVVYNPKTATLFRMAHEMIHAKYHDKSRHDEYDIHNPCEARANKEAIRWLWEIFTECGGSSAYFTNFIAITGCPTDQSWNIVKYYYPEGETA